MPNTLAPERLDALLDYMREYHQHQYQWPTYPEMAASLSVTRSTIERWLTRLQLQGRLINHGRLGRPEWEIVDKKNTQGV